MSQTWVILSDTYQNRIKIFDTFEVYFTVAAAYWYFKNLMDCFIVHFVIEKNGWVVCLVNSVNCCDPNAHKCASCDNMTEINFSGSHFFIFLLSRLGSVTVT